MKWKACLCPVALAAFVCMAGTAVAQPGLVAHWPLDEIQAGNITPDISGNNHNGTVVNGPSLVLGRFGNCLEFDRTDRYVDLPLGILGSDIGSASFWINTTADWSADRGHVFYGSSETGGNGGGGDDELHVDMGNAAEGGIGHARFFIEGGSADTNIASVNALHDGQWHHVVVTWQIGGNATMYVDGLQDAQAPHGALNFSFSAVFRLGRPGASQRWYSGLLDDVRIFNRVLTLTEVQQLFNDTTEEPRGRVTRTLPADFLPRRPFQVALTGTPAAGGEVVTTETVPAGLTATNVAVDAGTFTIAGQDIVWTVTLTSPSVQTLTYEVTPPVTAPQAIAFSGIYLGLPGWAASTIGGDNKVVSSVPTDLPFGTPVVKINFEDAAGDPTPAGYGSDTGTPYGGPKDFGFNYGWIDAADRVTPTDNTGETRNRDDPGSPDERYDSLIHVQRPGVIWEIELPNGDYDIFIAGGDPENEDQAEHILLEGITIVDLPAGQIPEDVWSPATSDGNGAWAEGRRLIPVADGRLTLEHGPNASNMKVMFIDIYGPPPAPAPAPVLSLMRVASNVIQLNWTDAVGEWGYVVERKADAGAFVQIAVLKDGTTSMIDRGLPVGVTYSYRVIAYNGTGEIPSNEPSLLLDVTLDSRSWHLYR